jgi:hypothetical protein
MCRAEFLYTCEAHLCPGPCCFCSSFFAELGCLLLHFYIVFITCGLFFVSDIARASFRKVSMNLLYGVCFFKVFNFLLFLRGCFLAMLLCVHASRFFPSGLAVALVVSR